MQIISNLRQERYKEYIAKEIKKKYAKLHAITVIIDSGFELDLDFYCTLEESLKDVKIIFISPSKYKRSVDLIEMDQ